MSNRYFYARVIFRLLNHQSGIALKFCELNECWQQFIAGFQKAEHIQSWFAECVGRVTGDDLMVTQIREQLPELPLTRQTCLEFQQKLPTAQPLQSFMSWGMIHQYLSETRLREKERWRLQQWCVQTDQLCSHLRRQQVKIQPSFFFDQAQQFLKSLSTHHAKLYCS